MTDPKEIEGVERVPTADRPDQAGLSAPGPPVSRPTGTFGRLGWSLVAIGAAAAAVTALVIATWMFATNCECCYRDLARDLHSDILGYYALPVVPFALFAIVLGAGLGALARVLAGAASGGGKRRPAGGAVAAVLLGAVLLSLVITFLGSAFGIIWSSAVCS